MEIVQDGLQLVLDKVCYEYGNDGKNKEYALKDISFYVKRGEIIGIIGHTGSGKSTLTQHLNGILKASSGTIYYDGKDIYDSTYDMRELRQKVGLVFQYPEQQLFETTVFNDVYFGPSKQDISKVEAQKRAFEALKMVGISDTLYDVSPFELSGGQKRRVAIAGVIAMAPEILVLDEPAAGLDPRSRKSMLDMIKQLHEQGDMTIIIVSHNMEDMAEYVDRIIVMHDGEIEMDDSPKKVFANYERLNQIGLSVPQVSDVCVALRNAGIAITNDTITMDETLSAIERYLLKNR